MNAATTAAVLLLLACITFYEPAPTRAHSWYPKECCLDHDCMSADGLYTDVAGNRIVVVGSRRVWVPPETNIRPSPDGRIHICFDDDVWGFQMPRCLFMPAQS